MTSPAMSALILVGARAQLGLWAFLPDRNPCGCCCPFRTPFLVQPKEDEQCRVLMAVPKKGRLANAVQELLVGWFPPPPHCTRCLSPMSRLSLSRPNRNPSAAHPFPSLCPPFSLSFFLSLYYTGSGFDYIRVSRLDVAPCKYEDKVGVGVSQTLFCSAAHPVRVGAGCA